MLASVNEDGTGLRHATAFATLSAKRKLCMLHDLVDSVPSAKEHSKCMHRHYGIELRYLALQSDLRPLLPVDSAGWRISETRYFERFLHGPLVVLCERLSGRRLPRDAQVEAIRFRRIRKDGREFHYLELKEHKDKAHGVSALRGEFIVRVDEGSKFIRCLRLLADDGYLLRERARIPGSAYDTAGAAAEVYAQVGRIRAAGHANHVVENADTEVMPIDVELPNPDYVRNFLLMRHTFDFLKSKAIPFHLLPTRHASSFSSRHIAFFGISPQSEGYVKGILQSA